MNERIRELAEEAGIFKPEQFRQHIDALQLQKFVELIVAECCVALHPMLRDMISRTQGVDMIVNHFKGEQ